jgi:glyoxylase-like metal-dependent hydrolase (beta-lactamase superfamily II)
MAITIHTFINEQYNANTYLIKSGSTDSGCYLIDIGNAEGVLKALKIHEEIKAIFLTHAHYDHICNIHDIVAKFPNCIIYCSAYTKEAMSDSKMNLSFYHKTPIKYTGNNLKIIIDQENINLFKGLALEVLETPGHNAGSLSYRIGQAIFTGDSLIPYLATVTKLKSGNKVAAQNSIIKIKSKIALEDVVFPGHGKSYRATEINWGFYFLTS